MTPGVSVLVKHGASSWRGTVHSVSPGHIVVVYRGVSAPGDDRPARELIDLSKRRVIVA